jgi:hypothetical protein
MMTVIVALTATMIWTEAAVAAAVVDVSAAGAVVVADGVCTAAKFAASA